MSEGEPALDLGRPRDVGGLLRDAVFLFFRYPWALLGIGAGIVVPVELAVLGFGLEQVSAPYEEKASNAEIAVSAVVSFFVVAPLVTAAVIGVVGDAAKGERPRAGRSLVSALEAFAPLLGAVILSAAGIALGLVALIVPGVYLLVRWYFVPQTVVIDGQRWTRALSTSWAVVEGAWWRTLGMVILVNLLLAGVGLLLLTPVSAAARAADRELVALAGSMALDTVTVTYVALVSTLLFHDLRARKARGV